MEDFKFIDVLQLTAPSYQNTHKAQEILSTFLYYALQPLRLTVQSELNIPTFVTRHRHTCHHARAPSGGRWNCGQEMSGNFA